MRNHVTGKHSRIIGIPILLVNRQPDKLLRHSNRDMTTPEELMTFGERLRLAREEAKLTQEQLAVLAGIKQSSVSELETGETKEISGPVLLSVCSALKINPHWLQGGKAIKKANPVAELSQRALFVAEVFDGSEASKQDAIFQVVNALKKQDNTPTGSN